MGIMEIFAQLEKNAPAGGRPQWIIAGLGNPGMVYENTRHNAGFMALDALAAEEGVRIDRMKFRGLYTDVTLGSERCLLLKPQTYMNNSGESVAAAMQFYKIDPAHLIVVFDDISLDPGRLRIRRKGSDGGHNGLKSIIALTGTEEFARIKLGVGKKPRKEMDLADWVLSKFRDEERPAIDEACKNAAAALRLMVGGKTTEAMNRFNS